MVSATLATSFVGTGMAASQAAPVPPEYKAYFDHALQSMVDYPFPGTE